MDLEQLRVFCLSLPRVTEDVKWEENLCFSIGGKMFCITSFELPLKATIKVRDEEFDELTATEDISPAPYLARYKWVLVEKPGRFSDKEWESYLRQSYELVRAKQPKKRKVVKKKKVKKKKK